ncbi:YigZ family protein [Taibaiella sp. KBW10]|uniref:IMPACT family protein n=1 Tax=Taibaiella sp. KBW10 TaxID=2153357 RepID=UPI000F59E5DB|nr:YigZ family protein [Taibaiella sp. KBW10]RQO30856.1 YigZ family protein [Taibaiella sp. KBW10]
MNTYKTIQGPTAAEFRDRGSKFLAYTFPINHVDEVKTRIQELKKEHPKAVHHCYAYRMGIDGLVYRANDDGEPSGSAGRPILGQIDSAGITNVLVVVVRYFGGTLLGVPGLINAYKTVTTDALALCETIERNVEFPMALSFDYTIMNEVLTVLKQYEVTIIKQDMQLFCDYEIGIPLVHKEACVQRLTEIYGLTLKAT